MITAEPGPNPHIGRVLIGDIRWLFPYYRIWKAYNQRYRAAVRKRGAWDADPNLREDISEDQYELWSLNPGTRQPWTALQVIRDVLTNTIDGLNTGQLFGQLQFLEEDADVRKLKSLSMENILIDDDGAGALRRALALLPGIGFYIGYDGEPRLYSKFNASMESDQVNELGPHIVDAGWTSRISNSTTRPAAVDVLFPRKCEVRFDYAGIDFARWPLKENGGNDRLLENVIPVLDPDFRDAAGNIVSQGEWLEASEYITALGAQAAAISSGRLTKVTRRLIDVAMIPWVGAWALIEAAGLASLALAQEKKYNFASRFAALQSHYLQTFRINPAWARSARVIDARLVGIFDSQTGTQAESPVWIDHMVVNSQKAMLVGAAAGVDFSLATKVEDARAENEPLNKDRPPSPFRVDILDMDAGLIRVTPRADVFANWSTLLPSPMFNVPVYNSRRGALAFDCVSLEGTTKLPELDSASARFNLVLTMVPATPNSRTQFHRVRVRPADLAAVLPDGAKRGIRNAKGPIKEVLVKDEVARVLWSDTGENIDLIHRMFALPRGGEPAFGPQPALAPPTREEAAGITLNDPLGKDPTAVFTVGRGADLWQIALGVAAQIYSGEQDRIMGSKTGPLRPGIRPAGFLSEIAHTVETDGTMVTHVQLPPTAPGIALESFLDDQTRKVLNKELGS